MNQKERIIELVNQGVITTEEALILLEKANDDCLDFAQTHATDEDNLSATDILDKLNQVVDEAAETGTKWVHDIFSDSTENQTNTQEDQTNQEQDDIEKLNKTISDIEEQIKIKEDARMIANQRLRELDIFRELEELTQDMQDDYEKLLNQKDKLNQEIADLQDQINTIKAQKQTWREQEWQHYSKNVKEKFGETADTVKDFKNQTIEGGRTISRYITDALREAFSGIRTKEVDVTIPVPWLKKTPLDHRFEFDGQEIKSIDLDLWKGSLDIRPTDKETMTIDSRLYFYGNPKEVSVDAFKRENLISLYEGDLKFKVVSPLISMDAIVYLPTKMYDDIQINLLSGDLSLDHIQMTKGNISQKNGQLTLDTVQANHLTIDMIVGDVNIAHSNIEKAVIRNIKGDIRINGGVGDIESKTINATYYITKTNLEPSIMAVDNMSGDIKIALPKNSGADITAEVKIGEVNERLEGCQHQKNDEDDATNVTKIHRQGGQTNQVDIQLTQGNVYLKDAE